MNKYIDKGNLRLVILDFGVDMKKNIFNGLLSIFKYGWHRHHIPGSRPLVDPFERSQEPTVKCPRCEKEVKTYNLMSAPIGGACEKWCYHCINDYADSQY